jgi:hypothetical protein
MNLPPPPNGQHEPDRLEGLQRTLEQTATLLQNVSDAKPKTKKSFPMFKGFAFAEGDHRVPMKTFILETFGIAFLWGLVGWFCSLKGWGMFVRPLASVLYHFTFFPATIAAALLIALLIQIYFRPSKYGIEVLCQLAVAYLLAYATCLSLFGFKF